MGTNYTPRERETLQKHVSELAGEKMPFNNSVNWLQNEFGLASERYARLLSAYPTLPAQFIVEREGERHNLALDNEERDRKTEILRKNQYILAAHRHSWFGMGEAVIVTPTPYGYLKTPVREALQKF